jgi:hypothetical protein
MGVLNDDGPGIVYLDQCAFGELFCANPRQGWVEVLSLLRRGVESGRIIAPISAEHLLETAGIKDLSVAEARFEQMFKLSRCVMFVPPEAIAARCLFAKVRRRLIRRTDVLGELHPDLKRKPVQYFSDRKKAADEDYKNRHLLHNGIVRPRGIISREDRHFMEEMKDRGKRKVFEGMLKVLDAFTFVGPLRELLIERCRRLMHVEMIVLNEFLALDPTPFDVSVLRFLLETGHDAEIPVLDVGSELLFNSNLKQKCKDRGDYYDMSRLQVAVPYADIVVTDREQLVAIKEQGLDVRYRTKVFSCSPRDEASIIASIKDLLA